MKKISRLITSGLLSLLLLSSCGSARQNSRPTPTAAPTATTPRVLPTPASPGATITWQDLQVRLEQVEISDHFMTEFGTRRDPPPGRKFFWAQVSLKNTGTRSVNFPAPEHFSLLYAGNEIKPTYAHRAEHPDYMVQDTPLFPGQEIQAWLRFDLPTAAGLQDLRFVFLPESAQLGVSTTSPDYPWGSDHPTYVWLCK